MVSQGGLGYQCWKTLGCAALTICSISVLRLIPKGGEQSDPTKTYCWYQVGFCVLQACYDPEVCEPAGTSRLVYPRRENPAKRLCPLWCLSQTKLCWFWPGFISAAEEVLECCHGCGRVVSVVGGGFPSCSPLEPGEQSWDWQYDVEAVIVCDGFEI